MENPTDPYFVKAIEYDDAESLFKDLKEINQLAKSDRNDYWIFRGHSNSSYKLQPYALRPLALLKTGLILKDRNDWVINWLPDPNNNVQVYIEFALLYLFYERCHKRGLYVPFHTYKTFDQEWDKISRKGKWIPKRLWELAALAQHHGLPTRLLDWTYDGFIAALFAVLGVKTSFSGMPSTNGNIEIWALNVSLIDRIKNKLADKNFPFHLIDPPNDYNQNIVAQQGTLSLWMENFIGSLESVESGEVDSRELQFRFEEYLSGKYPLNEEKLFLRLSLPHSKVADLVGLLEKYSYTTSKIFPGYGGIVKEIAPETIV